MAELTTVLQKIDEEAGVAWLTFNRPEKKNAMSQKFMAELIAALKELAENDKIKCIVTTGSGDSYSSGLDLYDLRESWKRKRAWDHAGTTYEIVRVLRNMPQVTVAAVRGWCLGGGLALINGHDLCIAGGIGEVRHAGSDPRQLRRGGDLDVVSQRYSDQESFLHSAHGEKSDRGRRQSGSAWFPRSCRTIS